MIKYPLLLLALVAVVESSGAGAPDNPPNILFVLADQWRAQALGFAGDPNVQTPHLDRFERQCVNFTQAAHAKLQTELDALLQKKLAAQRDDFRPGPEYIQKWNSVVDANETAPYQP